MRSLFALALLASTIASTNTSAAQNAETSLSTPIEIPASAAPSAPADGLTIDQIRAVVRDEIRKNPKLILDAVNAYSAEEQKNREAADRNTTLENKDLIAVSERISDFRKSRRQGLYLLFLRCKLHLLQKA
jgi:hypothetical protein